MKKSTNTLSMKTSGTQHLLERTYRESGRHQWVREVYMNAQEAGATKVEFGLEWQAVANKQVYRRMIADNGCGMGPEKLVEFFNTYGGGGKPIGGVHENFGVGSKTSLLPWNKHGLVIISWVNGEASMVWLRQDKVSGEYGLRLFRAMDDAGEETLEAVVTPFNDAQSGCDWASVKPDWIKDHGTVIVLLGNDPREDTILGDSSRDESDLKGISQYLNKRIWELPAGVEVTVDELRTSNKGQWPKSAHALKEDGRVQKRIIRGARYFIEYPEGTAKGKMGSSGIIELKDVKLRWYLWDGERPSIHGYAAATGFIAAKYKDEMYDATTHLATYRTFGVTDPGVRSRLWIVLEPKPYDDKTRVGVYPRTDRTSLLMAGGPAAGEPLPLHVWGAEFADRMPQPIKDALIEAHSSGSGGIQDPTWRDRLADRFGDRWRIIKLRLSAKGDLSMDPNQVGGEPVLQKKPRQERQETGTNQSGGVSGPKVVGSGAGISPAVEASLGVSIPVYRSAKPDELEPGMLAAWVPKDPESPSGVVLINSSHPVLVQQIKFFKDQYADHLAAEVEKEVLDVYGQVAVSKVAHSEKLKGILAAEVVDRELRSEQALTMSLLGLMAEEALITSRLTVKLGKRRMSAVPPEPAK